MTCREATAFIMDYLTGQLGEDVVARFERHLSRCEACRAYLASYRATLAMEEEAFADDPGAVEPVPEELIEGILEARRR
jgi:anti-sigma factor RsiW